MSDPTERMERGVSEPLSVIREALKVGKRWVAALDAAEKSHRVSPSRADHFDEKVQEAEYDFRDALKPALAALSELERRMEGMEKKLASARRQREGSDQLHTLRANGEKIMTAYVADLESDVTSLRESNAKMREALQAIVNGDIDKNRYSLYSQAQETARIALSQRTDVVRDEETKDA